MKGLIQAELYKGKKQTAFYVCGIFCLLAAVCNACLMQFSSSMLSSGVFSETGMWEDGQQALAGLDGLGYLGICFSGGEYLAVVIVVFLTLFISGEFSYGTIKNMASRGINRKKLYAAKSLAAGIFSLLYMLIYVVGSGLLGIILWGIHNVTAKKLGMMIVILLLEACFYFGVASLAALITMTIRHAGFSMVINICMMLMVSTGFQVLNMMLDNGANTGKIWLLSMVTELSNLNLTPMAVVRMLILAALYIIVPNVLGAVSFGKMEL